MKRINILILFFVLIQLNQLYSQFNTIGSLINEVNTLAYRNSSNTMIYANIDGSPYYSKDFKESVVYLKDGRWGKLPLRYDLFLDEIEFMKDNKTLWLIKTEIKKIQLGTESLVVSSLSESSGKLGYLFLQDSGKYTLYSKKAVEYRPYVEPKGYADPIPEKFEPKRDEFYLQIETNPLKKFRTKKELLSLLGNKSEIETYIKKEKIKTDKAEDLKKLFNYLNTTQ